MYQPQSRRGLFSRIQCVGILHIYIPMRPQIMGTPALILDQSGPFDHSPAGKVRNSLRPVRHYSQPILSPFSAHLRIC